MEYRGRRTVRKQGPTSTNPYIKIQRFSVVGAHAPPLLDDELQTLIVASMNPPQEGNNVPRNLAL